MNQIRIAVATDRDGVSSMSEPIDGFRWQSFFHHAAQPIFLLNRRRRLLFVNRSWEACTGLTNAEVRGRVCRRRAATSDEADEAILRACAPPSEAVHGQTCLVRRRAPGKADWWEIQFLPLVGQDGLLGMLGTIRVLVGPTESPFALPEQLMALRDVQATRYRLDDLPGISPAMRRLTAQARLASQTSVPITIVGEPGVGKSWLARAIHLHGERRQRYFIALDSRRLSAETIGDVLFGPRSRALAPGTVFLHEPGLLAREWQSRLVETLARGDDPEVPRYILGCTSPPADEVRAGRLLEDLACAAGTMTLQVPPLRERLGELPRLVDVFLKRRELLQPNASALAAGMTPEAMNLLRKQAWPENLTELHEVIRGASARARGDRIELADLPFHLKHASLPPERRLPLDTLLEQVERRLIALAMKLTQDNHTRAAEFLEIWRPRLIRRLEKFSQKEPDDPQPDDPQPPS